MAGSGRGKNTKRQTNTRGQGAIKKAQQAVKKTSQPIKTTQASQNTQNRTVQNKPTQKRPEQSINVRRTAPQEKKSFQQRMNQYQPTRRRELSNEADKKRKNTGERITNLTVGQVKSTLGQHGVFLDQMNSTQTHAPMNPFKARTKEQQENIRKQNIKRDIKLANKGAEQIEKGMKGLKGAKRDAAEVYTALLGTGMDIATGPLAPASLFSRAYGGAYIGAKQDGASNQQANDHAMVMAGVEFATEKMFQIAKPLEKVYGKGFADSLVKKITDKMSAKGGKNLAYHGTKGFLAALTEGLEEFVADGLDPIVANQIYANSTGNTKDLKSFDELMHSFKIGAIAGGIMGGAGQVAEYSEGKKVENIFGKDGLKELAKTVSESDEDLEMAQVATAIGQMVSEGKEVATGQYRELYNAAKAQSENDYNRMNASMETADVQIQENNFVQPTITDETGKTYIGKKTSEILAKNKSRAEESAKKHQLPEIEAEQITEAVARIETGVATVDDINLFTLSNEVAREIYQETTGTALPNTNKGTRDFLYEHMAHARVNSAEAETAFIKDSMRGVYQQDVARNYDTSGQDAIANVLGGVDPTTTEGAVQITVFDDFYRAGRSGMSYREVASIGNPFYKESYVREIKKAAYRAGAADLALSQDRAVGRQMQIGQAKLKGKKRGKGSLTTDLTAENRGLFTAQEQHVFRALARAFGIDIIITDKIFANGSYDGGKMYLSVHGDRSLPYIFAHEITHHLEDYAPEQYQKLKELVRARWQEKGGIDEAVKAKQAQYAQHEDGKGNRISLSYEGALNEIIADSTYEMIQDEQFVENIVKTDHSLAQAILNAIKTLIKKIRNVLVEGDKFTPQQNANLLSELGILTEAEQLWAEALAKAIENRDAVGNAKANKDNKTFSLMEDKHGNVVAYVDVNIFDGKENQKRKSVVVDYIKSLAENGSMFEIVETGKSVYIGKDLAGKYMRSQSVKRLDKERRYAKQRAITAIGDIVEIANNERWEQAKDLEKHKKDAKHGYYKYDSRFAFLNDDGGHDYYKVELVVRHDADGKYYLYDVQGIKKYTTETPASVHNEPAGSTKGGVVNSGINDIIHNNTEENNIKLSLSETDIREAVEEFFSDGNYGEARAFVKQNVNNVEYRSGLLAEIELMEEISLLEYDEINEFDISMYDDAFIDMPLLEDVTEAEIKYQPVVKTSDIEIDLETQTARYTDDRIDRVISEYGASDKRYAQAYISSMSPDSFLKLTLSDDVRAKWEQAVGKNADMFELDEEMLRNELQTPFLSIDEDGNVEGHEGRHRMRALHAAGIKNVPVVLVNYATKYTKQKEDSLVLSAQNFYGDVVNDGYRVEVNNLIPTNEIYKDEIKEAYGGEARVRFSLPETDSQGNTLSEGQRRYFDESKAVDENGRLIPMYHGSRDAGYTVFDPSQTLDGKSMFFTSDIDAARSYSGTYDMFEPLNITTLQDLESLVDEWVGSHGEIREDAGEIVFLYDGKEEWRADNVANAAENIMNEYGSSESANYMVYLNLVNPLIVDAKGNNWNELGSIGKSGLETTYDYAEYAKGSGYDGVIFENIYDSIDGDSGEATVAVAFDSEQVKDVNNLNPTEDRDIRYSIPETDSEGNTLSEGQREYFNDSKVLDEDGNLRRVYHGTTEDFDVFDSNKSRANMDIQGNFFSPWEIDARGYGQNVRAYYLNITNPAPESVAYSALNKFKGQNGAGVKAREHLIDLGYDGVNNSGEEYIAFYPEQIKEVSNYEPTNSPNVRFSVSTEKIDMVKASGGFGKTRTKARTGEESVRAIRERVMRENGYDEAYIENVNKQMDDMAKFMEDMGMEFRYIGLDDVNNARIRVRYGEDGEPQSVIMSAMVQNGEYPVNFDFTSICKKRQNLMDVINELARRKSENGGRTLDSVALSSETLWMINEKLREAGLETACLGCFVESKRYNVQAFAEKACNMWNSIVDEYRGDRSVEYFDFAGGVDTDTIDYAAVEEAFGKYVKVKDRKSPERRMRALIESGGDTYLKYLQPSDLMTPEGIEALKAYSTTKNNFYGILQGVYGQAAPKEVMGFTPYNSEIALLPKKKGKTVLKEYIKEIGGVRMQSFSDFLVANVYDYMQMVADLKARELTAHAYTKEISFARIFGRTGIKINLSVMFDIDPSIPDEYAGLQFVKDERGDSEYNGEKGRWEYIVGDKKRSDEVYEKTGYRPYVQSIGWDDAVELQNNPKYSANVGIIGVGYSDAHIDKMLADDNIPYIIPYHSSSLPAFIKDVTNIRKARDYTNEQNTRKFVQFEGTAYDMKARYKELKSWGQVYAEMAQIEKDGSVLKTKGGKNLAGTGNFPIYERLAETRNPKQTANEYLEWCGKKGYLPVFHQFADNENYYKVLFDFRVYDAVTGEFAPQNTVENAYPDNVKEMIREEMNVQNDEAIRRQGIIPGIVDEVLHNLDSATTEETTPQTTNEQNVRFSLPENPTDKIADETAVYDYIDENETIFTEVPPIRDYEVTAARTRELSIGELKAKVEKLQKNQKLTRGRVLDTRSIKEEANALIRNLMSYSEGTPKKTNHKLVKTIIDNAETMYTQMVDGNIEDVASTSYYLAEHIVENLEFVYDELFNEYKDLRDYLRTTKITISEQDKSNIPDYNDFRKQQMGRIRLVNEGGMKIDDFYETLLERYPGMFDETIDHPADQLQEIADVRDSLEPYDIMLSAEESDQLAKQTAQDILDIVATGKPWRSQADRTEEIYQQRLQQVKARHKEAMQKARDSFAERKEKLLKREAEKRKEAVKKEKEKGKKAIKTLKEQQKAREEKRKIFREKAMHKGRIAKNYKWLVDRLLKPSDDKHIPDQFKKALADMLQYFDLQSDRSKDLEEKYGKAKSTLKMEELRRALSELAREDGSGIFEYDGYIFELIDSLAVKVGDTPIDQLEANVLDEVDILLKAIVHNIRNYNTAFSDSLKLKVSELAEEIKAKANKRIEKRGTAGKRGGIFGGVDSVLNESMVTPRDFFEQIGMSNVFMAIRKGQDKHIRNMDTARTFFKELFGPYHKRGKPGSTIEHWRDSKQQRTFSLESGGQIRLNPAQIMSLYCLMKREQAVGHILGSGIVASDVTLSNKLKKTIGTKQERKVATEMVTINDVNNIIATLTQEQIQMADKMQAFLNNECAKWGNETSNIMYGYSKFTEENYFPIKSSEAYHDTKHDSRKTVEKIKNFSFTKGTVVNANDPIMIADIFEVVADHVNKMSLYNSFAAPIADFTRVYNHKTRNEEGKIDSSVKESIESAYGIKAKSYIHNFLADLQNNTQTKSDGVKSLITKSLANYKKATIGFNFRVALQQPTAIVRAFLLINPKYFVGASVNVKKNLREMKEHCPIALWKSWGFNNVDMARDMDDIMMNKEWSRWDVITMRAYGALDNVTWSCIWSAVKREVEAKHKDVEVGSQEYWELCNERASEIFDKTQVVDSPLHRSQVMRNQDTMVKMATSFMAEPTRTYNMCRSEIVMARELWQEGNKAKATKKMTKVMTVFISNAIAVSMAAAVADAMRGKDADGDGEDDDWLTNAWYNFLDNINPLNMIPLAKDVWGVAEGWSIKNMALQGWESLITSSKKFAEEPSIQNFIKVTEGIGLVTGVPVKNIIREFKMLGLDVYAAEVGEEEESKIRKGADRFINRFDISDGSWIDNILNGMGFNLTESEKRQKAYDEKLAEIESKLEGYSGKEYDDKLWSTVTSGYTKVLADGDIETIKEMRRIYLELGGDSELFDERVKTKTVEAYRKTIGQNARAGYMLREYLVSEHGYTDDMISSEVLAKSDVAKDFQIKLCEGDEDAATDSLAILLAEGITYNDIVVIYENRYKATSRKGADYATGELVAPVEGQITSGFGYRSSPGGIGSTNHQGIDIAVPEGTPVAAADGGRVRYAGYTSGKGYYIEIDHGNGRTTEYFHLSGYYYEKGETVSRGETIALSGNTGASTGPHLHFGVRQDGVAIDPMTYFQ